MAILKKVMGLLLHRLFLVDKETLPLTEIQALSSRRYISWLSVDLIDIGTLKLLDLTDLISQKVLQTLALPCLAQDKMLFVYGAHRYMMPTY